MKLNNLTKVFKDNPEVAYMTTKDDIESYVRTHLEGEKLSEKDIEEITNKTFHDFSKYFTLEDIIEYWIDDAYDEYKEGE